MNKLSTHHPFETRRRLPTADGRRPTATATATRLDALLSPSLSPSVITRALFFFLSHLDQLLYTVSIRINIELWFKWYPTSCSSSIEPITCRGLGGLGGKFTPESLGSKKKKKLFSASVASCVGVFQPPAAPHGSSKSCCASCASVREGHARATDMMMMTMDARRVVVAVMMVATFVGSATAQESPSGFSEFFSPGARGKTRDEGRLLFLFIFSFFSLGREADTRHPSRVIARDYPRSRDEGGSTLPPLWRDVVCNLCLCSVVRAGKGQLTLERVSGV